MPPVRWLVRQALPENEGKEAAWAFPIKGANISHSYIEAGSIFLGFCLCTAISLGFSLFVNPLLFFCNRDVMNEEGIGSGRVEREFQALCENSLRIENIVYFDRVLRELLQVA